MNPRRPIAACVAFRRTKYRAVVLAPCPRTDARSSSFPKLPFSRPGQNLAAKKWRFTNRPRGYALSTFWSPHCRACLRGCDARLLVQRRLTTPIILAAASPSARCRSDFPGHYLRLTLNITRRRPLLHRYIDRNQPNDPPLPPPPPPAQGDTGGQGRGARHALRERGAGEGLGGLPRRGREGEAGARPPGRACDGRRRCRRRRGRSAARAGGRFPGLGAAASCTFVAAGG